MSAAALANEATVCVLPRGAPDVRLRRRSDVQPVGNLRGGGGGGGGEPACASPRRAAPSARGRASAPDLLCVLSAREPLPLELPPLCRKRDRCRVARLDVGLQAVQLEVDEGGAQDELQALAHVSLAGERLSDGVPQVGLCSPLRTIWEMLKKPMIASSERRHTRNAAGSRRAVHPPDRRRIDSRRSARLPTACGSRGLPHQRRELPLVIGRRRSGVDPGKRLTPPAVLECGMPAPRMQAPRLRSVGTIGAWPRDRVPRPS